MGISTDKMSTKLLKLLLLADLAFICIHCFYRFGILSNPLFSIEQDMAYPEIYQYIKEFWIVVLLLILANNRRHIIYLSWSLLFIYLLLDDSLAIHETFGEYLVKYFEFKPMFELRAQDYGELCVSMLFGLLLFTFIGVSYFFSDNLEKKISKHLFILIVLLAFFGVLVDMLHVAIHWRTTLWGLIEDGGEMIIMSVIVWYIFGLGNSEINPPKIQIDD